MLIRWPYLFDHREACAFVIVLQSFCSVGDDNVQTHGITSLQRGEADLCSLEVACQTFDQTPASALEELFDFGDVVGAAIGWERVEESGAVARGADARVE